jgi:hypothetical protein
MTGRMYNERLEKLHFRLMLPAFWVMSIGQMTSAYWVCVAASLTDPALGIEARTCSSPCPPGHRLVGADHAL